MSINDEMKTSQIGLELITKWEGLKLNRYTCIAGKPTIGVGHVILPGENYQTITREQAMDILAKDVERFEKAVKKHITVKLNQNQFDALVSFIFNTGEGGIINTGVQKAVNSGNFEIVPEKLLEWSKARINGVLQTNKGLYNRRLSEGQLFSKPVQGTTIPEIKMMTWTKTSLMKAQESLAKLKLYTLKIDGLWGPGTQAALLAFANHRGFSIGNDPKKEIPLEVYEALTS
jgi:GH24 family phage-related lysozyme (muramidase)